MDTNTDKARLDALQQLVDRALLLTLPVHSERYTDAERAHILIETMKAMAGILNAHH